MAERTVQCVVVTPEKAILDEPVDFVAVPMYDGELGVLPGRAPLIGRLGTGELRTQRGGKERRVFIDGGFVQIRQDVVTVLTHKAVREEELTVAGASKALEEAQQPGKTPEEQEAKLRGQLAARVKLRMARRREKE